MSTFFKTFYLLLLISVIPTLYSYSLGFGWWNISDIIIPSIVIFFSVLALFLILLAAKVDYLKSLIVTLFSGWLFFQFESLTELLFMLISPLNIININSVYYFNLFVLGLILLVLVALVRKRNIDKSFLTFIILIIHVYAIFPITSIIQYNLQLTKAKNIYSPTEQRELIKFNLSDEELKNLPDIYYVLPDGYASNKTFNRLYNFDNTQFTDYLKDKGFHVTYDSYSNYMQTHLSLGSSLNLDLLQNLYQLPADAKRDGKFLEGNILNNLLTNSLKKIGYDIFSIPNSYDVGKLLDERLSKGSLLSLKLRILQLTPINSITKILFKGSKKLDLYTMHSDISKTAFSSLKDLARKKSDKPKFIFALLNIPHPPFLFDSDGNILPQKDIFQVKLDAALYEGWNKFNNITEDEAIPTYRKGYINQVKYTNKEITSFLDTLFKTSSRPFIIIIQGDHGPASLMDWDDPANKSDVRERTGILNAYYFFDKNYKNLYQKITPVNSFRIILNQYFKTDFPLIEDKTYASPWESPHNFTDITERLD